MVIRNFRVVLALMLWGAGLHLPPAASQTFRVVTYMYYPWISPNGIVEGSPGLFYFYTAESAQAGVFSITTGGSKTFLTTFPLNASVQAPLVSASNHRLYSATQHFADPPNVFSVDSAPGKQVYAAQSIVPDVTQNLPDGSLLGVGAAIAANPWYLVKVDVKGSVTPIYTFPSGERLPQAAVYASDGNYYGVSYLNDGSGYVYRVTPKSLLTKLLYFPPITFVGNPGFSPLLQAHDGNLYGATLNGGANGTGTIYKLTLDGQYSLLYTFPKGINYNPMDLIEASDGNLYGATLGDIGFAELFKVTTSGQHTTLFSMVNLECHCLLTQGSDGIIYGTAQHFHPSSGPVGTKVRLWGHNLLEAAVEFNGVPATKVSSSGPNYVYAVVPPGATTGSITITTPGGSTTTQATFIVEP